jgi:4-hydroxy-tetrahydrodipicolinate reductase
METITFGNGPLGTSIHAALAEREMPVRMLGRPPDGTHDSFELGRPSLAIEASRGGAVASNVRAALAAGCRRLVIATTGWDADRAAVERAIVAGQAAAVVAPNFSIGAAVFGRIVDEAAELLGVVDGFEPYIVEWHRREKTDRPSGTARDLARRVIARRGGRTHAASDDGEDAASPEALEVAAVRAGSSPGMHLVGFDSASETIELRLTARDRNAYASGVVAAITWLTRTPRAAGVHPFDAVVDELLTTRLAATA